MRTNRRSQKLEARRQKAECPIPDVQHLALRAPRSKPYLRHLRNLRLTPRDTSRRLRLSASICGCIAGIGCICMCLMGCESGAEQYKPEPNVHCLMRTDEGTVTLMAGMTVGYYDSVSNVNEWQGTSGVMVGISNRGNVIALTAVADSPGYYRTDSLSVVPGDSYSLSLTYPGGMKVSGSTVVPDTFAFVNLRVDTLFDVPWPGDTYAYLNLSCSWRESRGATGYFEQLNLWYRSAEDSILLRYGPNLMSVRRDSWTFGPFYYRWDTLSGELVDSLPLDRVTIEVKAIERNYSDYISLGYMGGVDPDKMHLDGGVGVFGSACIIDSTLRLRPNGPAPKDPASADKTERFRFERPASRRKNESTY